ncbi:hypothetical protein [Limosilactobacillus reuteri]|uniref:hypothetical protein n=1 Tax=Limosilactobacillus reuteri TaxID=1598 RepID=UPI002F261578
MKKIGLICVTALIGMSLTACSNSASQKSNKKSSSSSVTTTKAVKHHKVRKESKKDTQSSVISNGSSSVSETTQTQNSNTNSTTAASASTKKFDKSDPSTWDDVPYKGYPSYSAYCEANGGDPEVQAETAKMQHDWNVQQGIENPDGSETQNFQNWVSKGEQAEANGQSIPSYDQNVQW